jgi:transposase-like protein
MVDGVEFRKESFVVALGIDKTGTKTILGYHQGATENRQICDRLLEGIAARGLDLRQGMLAVLDGGPALAGSIRRYCGDKVLVQRCQQHIAGRVPRFPEGWNVLSRASPYEPGSLGSDMAG